MSTLDDGKNILNNNNNNSGNNNDNNNNNGADLAQKYKEKALARRRGAGTHQPKFRGFTLTKSSDNATSTTTQKEKPLPTPIVEIVSTRTRSLSKTTETSTIVPNATKDTSAPNSNTPGLNEKYQERFKSRLRGTGTHQPDFRGFSLKTTTSKNSGQLDKGQTLLKPISTPKPDSTLSGKSSTSGLPSANSIDKVNNQVEDPERSKAKSGIAKRAELTKALKALSINRSGSNSESSSGPTQGRTGSSSTPASRRHTGSSHRTSNSNRYVDTTKPIEFNSRTPSSKMTRSASRSSGYSPNFKVTWGKSSSLFVTSEPKEPPKTNTIEPEPLISDQGPSNEDNFDDMGAMDNLDYNDDHIPSPTHETPHQELDSNQQKSISDTSVVKRKPTSTHIPEPSSAPIRKSGIAPTKRRRLIQEEADENEDPLPDIQNKSVNISNINEEKGKSKSSNNKDLKEKQPVEKQKSKSRDVDRSAPKSKRPAVVTTTASKSSQDSARPLRQTTLMQLASRSAGADDGAAKSDTPRARYQESSDSESDFRDRSYLDKTQKPARKPEIQSSSKKSGATSKKGKTLDNYKQLQIHCLKFWGPSNPISRPATVTSRAITKDSTDAEGSTSTSNANKPAPVQKTIQSVLEIDDAPLTEMDVIAEAVREVVDDFINSIEDQSVARELLVLRSDLETVLIEQVDMLDDHTLLKASARKAAALKKELRARLLVAQRGRQKTREELRRVRSSFEREERARRRLEETHTFLTDLEALRDQVEESDGEENDSVESNNVVKTGLQSFIATVGSRSGKASTETDHRDSQSVGMLGKLQEFNKLLSTMEKNLKTMPLVTHSQKATSSRRYAFDDDDDLDDSEFDFANI